MSISAKGPLDLGGAKVSSVATPTATDDAATKGYVDGLFGSGSGGDVITGDTGQSAGLVAGSRREVAFTTTTVQAVGSTDVSNYRWISVHVVSQGGSSTVNFQGSNDNTNWTAVALVVVGSTTPTLINSTVATGIFHGPATFRYFRLNVTGIASGTTAGVIEFLAMPAASPGVGIAVSNFPATQPVSGTVAVSGTSTVDTELPAAAALADATANPTVPTVGGAGLVYNGTTWDRARSGTAANTTAGTGLLGVAIMGYDTAGSRYLRVLTDTSGNQIVSITGTPTVDTELPAAAALADATANPTTPLVGGAGLVYNGSTWDRKRTVLAANAGSGLGVPAAGAMGWDGTNSRFLRMLVDTTGNQVVTVTGTASVVGGSSESSGSAAANNTNLLSLEVRGYNRWSLQLTGTWTASIGVQVSNDGVTWTDQYNFWQAGSTTPTVQAGATLTSNGLWYGSVISRYLRIRTTAYTSGTATALLELLNAPGDPVVMAQTSLNNPSTIGDGQGQVSTATVGAYRLHYNGVNWDRARSATIAAGTTGLGVPASGEMGFDGTNWQRAKVDSDGTRATVARAGTAALTNVTSSASTGTVLAANTARRGAYVYNDSTAVLYLKFGATASATSYTVQVAPGQFYELPRPVYTGIIDGIWASANGFARVTEVTA